MMTLDEAIKHCEEVADKGEKGRFDIPQELEKCAEKHRQLAERLKELKWWRSHVKNCTSCKYENKARYDEPCLTCQNWKNWKCGYEGGEQE